MADNKAAGAPALDTNIESGGFDEKRAQHVPAAAAPPKPVDEEEDEDMDALIEDLESEDGHDVFDDDEEVAPGGGRVVPEDMLQTDSRVGLTEAEVIARRRKYGLNQMKEEKENLVLKFLGFFIGPIQFVMEVSSNISLSGPPFPQLFQTKSFEPQLAFFLATLETACFFPRLSLVLGVWQPLRVFGARLQSPQELSVWSNWPMPLAAYVAEASGCIHQRSCQARPSPTVAAKLTLSIGNSQIGIALVAKAHCHLTLRRPSLGWAAFGLGPSRASVG